VRVALTGGIASGKSTVAALLTELGAVVVDSDQLAREVVEPGTPGLAAVTEAFGFSPLIGVVAVMADKDADGLLALVTALQSKMTPEKTVSIAVMASDRASEYAERGYRLPELGQAVDVLALIALVGPVAVAAIGTLHLDMLFLGVHGMSERAGYTTPNLMEADVNRALVEAAERLVVLADHTKWGTVGISSIVALERADVLITDDGLDEQARALLDETVPELVKR